MNASVDYEQVARLYRKACSSSSKPSLMVADWLGISHSNARARISRARMMGLIEPTSQGRSSATMPTPKLRAVADDLGVEWTDLARAICEHAGGDLRVSPGHDWRSDDEVLADQYLREIG